ncbi:hypothetical protein DWF00_23400 [Bosea caraganae]|uniref:Uncharacterized protein n=1 Tax=Bosea caraganae TaxID=2763117 RepID=A0A370L2B0_9HYPH|nr:hypothetical protein [Bosea caraganae]RDJ22209.1 hypothetical protein DWE98_20145 [Bosea caraganae]RDJ22704.1 hypothetical protein DWF00_23400 [Bosea caraganae]
MRRRNRAGQSALPPRPDFDALEAAAQRSGEQRLAFLAQIGDLNFAWSNNESMFIYVLMLLLDTSEAAAAIVFSTLNTTRSRLDLVQRLAKITLRDEAVKAELDEIVAAFSASTRLRNDLSHATFVIGAAGDITHTQSMKLEESKGQLRFGSRRAIDQQRLDQIAAAVSGLYALNRRIWDVLPKLERSMRADWDPEPSS